MEPVVLVMIMVCVFAILAVVVFIYHQMENTKKFVKDELARFATLVNDAQYNEFTFDKQTQSNITNIDQRLKDISNQLKALKSRANALTKAQEEKDISN